MMSYWRVLGAVRCSASKGVWYKLGPHERDRSLRGSSPCWKFADEELWENSAAVCKDIGFRGHKHGCSAMIFAAAGRDKYEYSV